MLQYDDSAFYFFMLSILSFYLIPSWWSILSRIVSAFLVKDEQIGAVSRTSAEKHKADDLKKESKGLGTLFKSRPFLYHLAFTIALTFLFVWLAMSVTENGQVNSFDPFAILEIDTGADAKVIKKAYRKLSLQYHPDKNPGNRAAEAKFMMVSKAYEALTDETAKENWEKYGNPDGKQSLEVSIGLPTFLLDTNNRNLVLVGYLIIMVGLVPFSVYTYYSDSSRYGEKDVMYDTYSWFHRTLSEHSLMKSLPEAFAGAAEFRKRNMPKNNADKEAIGQLTVKVRSQMQKPKWNHPVCVKGNVLMHTHLLRKTELLGEELMDDLKFMLRKSGGLIDAMIQVCKHQDWMQTAIQSIEFGQLVAQAMWIKDSALMQLPHYTADEVKVVEKMPNKPKTIQEFRELPEDERKGMNDFSDQQKKDVANYLKIFPDVTLETKVFVDDDEDNKVYEGDLVTIQVILTRNNLETGQKVGPVHAPLFPFPIQESWWVILGQLQQGKIISIEKITNPYRRFETRIKFLSPPKGTYVFDLLVKSNAYVGCDMKAKVEMEVMDNAALPEYKIHPDDAELDDEPTLWEEMLNANVERDSDDEDSDDEEEDENAAAGVTGPEADQAAGVEQGANKKKAQLRKARQQEDDSDDEDDDSEAEEVYADK